MSVVSALLVTLLVALLATLVVTISTHGSYQQSSANINCHARIVEFGIAIVYDVHFFLKAVHKIMGHYVV